MITKQAREEKTTATIRAPVCPSCGRLLYPAPLVCRCGCVLEHVHPVPLELEISGHCTLLTWTRVKAVPEGFDDAEMLLGMVEFDGGIRAVGALDVCAPRVGMELWAEVQPCSAGEYRCGPRYVLREVVCANSSSTL